MKKWTNPELAELNISATANDPDPGKGGDGFVWVTNNDGSGGWPFPDFCDNYGPKES